MMTVVNMLEPCLNSPFRSIVLCFHFPWDAVLLRNLGYLLQWVTALTIKKFVLVFNILGSKLQLQYLMRFTIVILSSDTALK